MKPAYDLAKIYMTHLGHSLVSSVPDGEYTVEIRGTGRGFNSEEEMVEAITGHPPAWVKP